MPKISTDLKIAALTASYSGLGFELCRLLLANSYQLVCFDRDVAKSTAAHEKLIAEFPQAHISRIPIDMASHAAIDEATQNALKNVDHIDLLFHVAGAATSTKRISEHNNELQFQVNTLGPVILTEALRPLLANAERSVVVTVGSSAMKMSPKLKIEDLVNPSKFKKMTGAYAQSKFAITTVMTAWASAYLKDGILLRVVDPGPSKTDMSASAAMPSLVRFIRRWFPHPRVGAAKIFAAANADQFADRTGIYIERGKIAILPKDAANAQLQQKLLQLISDRLAQSEPSS